MSEATYIVGDVFDVMATLPDSSVDLVLTSPPFLALRSYLPADHPDKAKEIGSEPTPAEFIDTLLALTAEWDRVLAPHGSICVELGDTYAGSNAGGERTDGGQYGNWPSGGTKYNLDQRPAKASTGWPLDKSLTGIPTLYAWSLAYGRNLLTGEPSPAGQWRVRNVVAWVRPNPPVGALGDKFRPGTSYITMACKARDRWFDLDDVRGEPSPNTHARTAKGVDSRPSTGKAADDERRGGNFSTLDTIHSTAGAPPLDWWQVSTEPYSGSHYATWPRKLLERPIRSMCPSEVCRTCGEPRRRMTAMTADYALSREEIKARPEPGKDRHKGLGYDKRGTGHRVSSEYETLGFTDCGHDDYRRGVVLDPFAGSGTTLAVATGLGRDAIGIDIDKRNLDLAYERVGMFLKETT